MPDSDTSNIPFVLISDGPRPPRYEPVPVLFGVLLTPDLRSSGLLAALPVEDMQCLLYILSSVTPHGVPRTTVHLLAKAMRLSKFRTHRRLERLTRFIWQGEPLIHKVKHSSDEVAYLVSRRVLRTLDINVKPLPPREPMKLATEQELISWSRATYAKRRAEVEQMIAVHMGWDKRYGPSQQQREGAKRELKALGLSDRRIGKLFEESGVEEAIRQLAWLPYREAKDPKRLIVAAIRGRYEEPKRSRTKRSASEIKEP